MAPPSDSGRLDVLSDMSVLMCSCLAMAQQSLPHAHGGKHRWMSFSVSTDCHCKQRHTDAPDKTFPSTFILRSPPMAHRHKTGAFRQALCKRPSRNSRCLLWQRLLRTAKPHRPVSDRHAGAGKSRRRPAFSRRLLVLGATLGTAGSSSWGLRLKSGPVARMRRATANRKEFANRTVTEHQEHSWTGCLCNVHKKRVT